MKISNLLPLILLTSQLSYAETKRRFTDEFKDIANQLQAKILGTADLKGLTITSRGHKGQASWSQIHQDIKSKVSQSRVHNIDDPTYKNEFDSLTHGYATTQNSNELLIDGLVSFEKRKKMIEEAQKSIYLMVWAVYDDRTGEMHTEWLLEKFKQNPQIDIKILVDGQTALMEHHSGELKKLSVASQGKIQIIKWFTHPYRGNGSHRKIFVVDEKEVIMGGMNVGDDYHFSWRDTDIFMEGDVGVTAANLFRKVWNQQIREHKLKFTPMALTPEVQTQEAIKTTLLDHSPGVKGEKGDHNLLMAYSKLIQDATTSVDIENAYFILNSVLREALSSAIKRGVKVRVLTNSDVSVDEPIVSVPILESALEAFNMGAEMYLRQGTTLHTKAMIIDGKVALIGSDNLHPRSQRFEGEVMVAIFDQATARQMTEMFENDLKAAKKIQHKEDIVVKHSFISRLVKRLFYSHL